MLPAFAGLTLFTRLPNFLFAETSSRFFLHSHRLRCRAFNGHFLGALRLRGRRKSVRRGSYPRRMTLGIIVFAAVFLAGLGLGTMTRRPLATACLVVASTPVTTSCSSWYCARTCCARSDRGAVPLGPWHESHRDASDLADNR